MDMVALAMNNFKQERLLQKYDDTFDVKVKSINQSIDGLA